MRTGKPIVVLLAMLALSGLLLPALGASAHEGPHVRMAHLAPGLQPVDVYANGDLVVKALKYKDASTYLALEGSEIEFVVAPAGGKITDSLTEKPVRLAFSEDEGTHFTVAMVGSPKDKTFELVKLPADYAEAEPTEAAHSESKVGEAAVGTLVVSGAFVRATAAVSGGMMATQTATQPAGGMGGMGAVSAAYFQIKNTGDKADQLVSVTCDVAGVAELHMTTVKDSVAQMQPVPAIDVPANGSAELKPGGYHVMLMQLKKDLVAGQTVTLTLTFKSGVKVTLTAPVKAP